MIIKSMNLQPFYSPIDTGISLPADTDTDQPSSRTDILNALNTDDEVSDDKDETELDLSSLNLEDDKESKDEDDKESSEDEDDKEKKLEEDKEFKLDEENEDELELARIPRRAEIKAAYPDIFKKFPQLDHIIQRQNAYAEVFPTIADAKTAKDSVDAFNKFQNELLSGDIENVLKQVKNTNAKAFNKISTDILDTLVKIDPNAHLAITHQVSKGVLNYIHTAAANTLKKNPDDKRAQQLEIAAELIHEALYDTKEVTPATRNITTDNTEDPEKIKFNKEKEEFEKSRYSAAFTTVSTKVGNLLTSVVTRDIDPKNILPEYVKKTVVKDVMSELDRQLMIDKPFKGLIDKLWIKARDNGYNDKSINDIQTALKEKAKTILPAIMKAKKGEAMKGLTTRKKESSDDSDRQSSRNNEDKGTPPKRLTNTKRDEDRNQRKPGESIRDFLMRD